MQVKLFCDLVVAAIFIQDNDWEIILVAKLDNFRIDHLVKMKARHNPDTGTTVLNHRFNQIDPRILIML